MTIHHLVFNPYEVNVFIIASTDGQCIIVDPACCSPEEQDKLKNFIADKGLHPVWLVNTHGHYDHITGNAFVCRTWTLNSAAHRDDLFLMENAYNKSEIFGFPVEKPPTPTVFPEEGDTVGVGDDVSLQVIHLPGHSPGSILLYSPVQKWIITGDVLFKNSIGRTDLPGGDFDLLMDGIRKKLVTLPPDTAVFPGHGPFTTIEKEMKTNPFLKRLKL